MEWTGVSSKPENPTPTCGKQPSGGTCRCGCLMSKACSCGRCMTGLETRRASRAAQPILSRTRSARGKKLTGRVRRGDLKSRRTAHRQSEKRTCFRRRAASERARRLHQLNRPVGAGSAVADAMMTGDQIDRGRRLAAEDITAKIRTAAPALPAVSRPGCHDLVDVVRGIALATEPGRCRPNDGASVFGQTRRISRLPPCPGRLTNSV